MQQFAKIHSDSTHADTNGSRAADIETPETRLLRDAARLVNSPSGAALDQTISEALHQLVVYLGVEFAVLRLFDYRPRVLLPIRFFAAGDVREFVLPDNHDRQLPWYSAQIRAGKVISLPHGSEDLPVEAVAERDYMARFGLCSLLVIPIEVDDQCLASLTLGARKSVCVWRGQAEQSVIAFAQLLGGILRRQATDDALHSYQGQLHTTLARAHLDVWALDLRHPARSFTSTMGFAIDGYVPNHLPDVINLLLKDVHPVDRTSIADLIGRCSRGELETFAESYRLHTAGEDPLWVESKVYLVRDGQGVPSHVTGVTQDISARKVIEDELEAQRQALLRQTRLMAQTEQTGQIGGWEWEVSSDTLYWTPETYRIHGLRPEEYTPTMAKSICVFNPEGILVIRDAVQHALVTGEGYLLTLELITAQGDHVWVRTTGHAQSENGRVVRLYGSFQDITHQTQVDEQLRQSQKLELAGQLAGGIAHDFNNLLTVINGLSELSDIYLQRVPAHADVERVRHYLTQINRAGRRAGTLTRQLLAFGRRQLLQPHPIHLGEFVHAISAMLRRLLGNEIQLSILIAPDLRQIMADPGQMEQVLVSLVVNASDAMPDGGEVTIELVNLALTLVEAERDLGLLPTGYVALSVHDTGVGMAPEVLEHIFEPFFTTKPIGTGTGLGLAMVYGIVRQSGGHISVESELGRGTSFRILFPIYAPVADAQADDRSAQGNPA